MNKPKTYPTLFFFIFLSCISLSLISFSSIALAADEVQVTVKSLGTFDRDSTIYLTQTCDNCTYVNITRVEFPRSIQAPEIINEQMTESVKGNFDYSFSNTHEFGDYIVTTCGDPNGNYACESYSFTVGNLVFVYILLIGGIVLLGGGAIFKLPVLGLASGVLLSIAGIYFIVLVSDVYSTAIGYTSLFVGVIVGFSAASEYFYE